MFFAFFLVSFLLIISVQAADNWQVASKEPASFETLPLDLQRLITTLLVTNEEFVDLRSALSTTKGWNTVLQAILHDQSGDYVYELLCRLMPEVKVKAEKLDSEIWCSRLKRIWNNLQSLGVPEVALKNIAERLVTEIGASEFDSLYKFIDSSMRETDSTGAAIPLKEFILPLIRHQEISPTHNLPLRLLLKYGTYEHQGALELFKEAYETIPGVKIYVVANNGDSELDLASLDKRKVGKLVAAMLF